MWVLIGALFILVIAGGAMLFRYYGELKNDEARIAASCAVARDIGGSPLTIIPTTGKPTLLSVKVVVDFRNSYIQRACPGALPPPSAQLIRWAAFYHQHLIS